MRALRPLYLSNLLALVSMTFALAGHANSHGLLHEVFVDTSTLTVHFFYEGGREKPMFEQYEIFSPNSEITFQEGHINVLGEVSFRPDQSGVWQIRVITRDGHARNTLISVPEAVPEQDSLPIDNQLNAAPTTRLITVVGYLLGIFGLIMLWRQRPAWRKKGT